MHGHYMAGSFLHTLHRSAEDVPSEACATLIACRRVPRSPATKLDVSRLGRTVSSCASCSCGASGGVTIRCQVEQECQDHPEPAPTGHTSRDIVDEDIGQ